MDFQETTTSLVNVNEDDLETKTIYKICNNNLDGKRLYLAQTTAYLSNWEEAKTYDWQINLNGTMEFEDKEEAENFAKQYFNKGDDWYICET